MTDRPDLPVPLVPAADPGSRDADGRDAQGRTGSRPVWQRIPWQVRLCAVWSACLLLLAGGLYLLGIIAVALAPLTIALAATLFLAALLRPVFDGLCRLRLPRAAAALGAVLVLLATVIGPTVLVWQLTVDQFEDLPQRLREGLARTRELLTAGDSPISREQLDRLAAEVSAWSRTRMPGAGTGEGARTLFEVLGSTLLVVILLFFLLKDGPGMWDWVLGRASERARPALAEVGSASWQTLTRYARGTFVIAAIDAAGIGIALVVLRVPLALPLALITFVAAFVPIIGATLAGSVAVLVALAANGPVTALLTAAAVIAVQQTEGNLLEPLIMKRQVRLHPVVVLVAVTAGTLAWGVAGAFVAVPMTAVLYRGAAILAARRAAADAGGPVS